MSAVRSLIHVLLSGLAAASLLAPSPDRAESAHARVVFVSDTHASVDAKNRDPRWAANSSTRLDQLFADDRTRPTHLVWLGDIIDFLPAEWDIARSWVARIQRGHPSVKQYAVMGNHDYFYYPYPAIMGKFNSSRTPGYLSTETESFLRAPVKAGDTRLLVTDARRFLPGRQILLIRTPDRDGSSPFQIRVVKAVDAAQQAVDLTEPANVFQAGSTAVRQGFTERRGIAAFLSAFSGTETRDTKGVFLIGNTCFIRLSMDRWFDRDTSTHKSRAIPDEDLRWFETQLAKYSRTHNVVVLTHELPESGKVLGGLHDPNDATDLAQSTRDRLMALIRRYPIAAWISGHTHPNARTDAVSSTNPSASFLLVPSLGMCPEGQALVLDLHAGATALDFQYWSTDQHSYFERISVPIRHRIRFRGMAPTRSPVPHDGERTCAPGSPLPRG